MVKEKNKSTSERVAETWNTLTGVMRVWGKEFGEGKKTFLSFTASVGKKVEVNHQNEYVNEYIKVKFSKDCEESLELVEGENIIDIENAFFSVETWEDKKGNDCQKLVIVVTEASNVEAKPKKKSKHTSSDEDEDE